ncbi:Potassium channel [Pleosporales sp. CAS-2024a]
MSPPPPPPQQQQHEQGQEQQNDASVRLTFSVTLKKKKRWWNVFKERKKGQQSDWWFASTGIPLLAATLGPLANVSSIAALVTSWRQTNYIDGVRVPDFEGVPYADPRWCYWINVASLICGFLGNLALLLNFTQRIRYIVALPASIVCWYLSSGFLIAVTACMHIYVPPQRPNQGCECIVLSLGQQDKSILTHHFILDSQGFWYAIAAAALYTACSMLLMINMLGYFLGHYPENFQLSDSQRTLILQSMAFFIWLAGGAALFSKIERDSGETGWNFPDALYFCDVTILTVGFGDMVPTTDVSRGIVFPYSVGGIITLALIVSSLYRAVREIGEQNVIQKHVDHMRTKALSRTVTNSFDLRHGERTAHHLLRRRNLGGYPRISTPVNPRPLHTEMSNIIQGTMTFPRNVVPDALNMTRKPKLLLLKEEKDRFDTMRQIQADGKKFRRWMALFWSVSVFSILWCVGAVVFWQAEKKAQDMTYFKALYLCYISLLTIGYGDLAPKTNAGRCFFVIWSLVAVPTMTILVSDLGDTVVAKFKKWSDQLADFTVLPKEGIWRAWLEKLPWLLDCLERYLSAREAKRRIRNGFDVADPCNHNSTASQPSTLDPDADADPDDHDRDLELAQHPTMPILAAETERDAVTRPTRMYLSRQLALSIQKVCLDFRLAHAKRYSYEEWVEFTRLIRMTTPQRLDHDLGSVPTRAGAEQEEGLVNWDWIGNDSPMMSGMTEPAWLLDRLCESLVRLEKRREVAWEMGEGGLEGFRAMREKRMAKEGGEDMMEREDGGGEMESKEEKQVAPD